MARELGGFFAGLHSRFDFVGEPVEVLMQPVEHFPLSHIGRQVADERGLSSISPELFERGSIVLHGLSDLLVYPCERRISRGLN